MAGESQNHRKLRPEAGNGGSLTERAASLLATMQSGFFLPSPLTRKCPGHPGIAVLGIWVLLIHSVSTKIYKSSLSSETGSDVISTLNCCISQSKHSVFG